jgi:phage/plasmid-associated DNA primase
MASPDVELNPRTPNNPDINAILAKHPKTDDPLQNLKLAEKIITDNYLGASRSEVILYHLKKHFKLSTDAISILKMFWLELYKEHKESLQAVEIPKVSRKVTSEATRTPIESLKELQEPPEILKETRKEAKEREDKEAQDERDRIHNEEFKKKQERKAKAEDLYKLLENEDGTHTEEQIEAIKKRIKDTLLQDFWSFEGKSQNNPGYVVLNKLVIADYLCRTYRLIRYGGNNWHYDWTKGFYTYDNENLLLHKEICDIMNEVGIHDDDNIYNEHITADKANIIDFASRRDGYTTNPFNKYTDLINAKNGVLKVDYVNKKVTFLGKQPKYLFSYSIDTEYRTEIQNDVIHDKLGEIAGEEQRELIYQMAAMAIRDTNIKLIPSKVAYLLIGRNEDKYTVMHLLGKFFGHRIVTRLSLNEIATNKYTKPLLEGKLINLDNNLPDNIPLDESRELKSLTGGKFHTLEPKHVKPYSGIITTLLVFACDNFPKCSISKNDTAFWDRWEIITFEGKAQKVDEDYFIKLLTPENLSGFFNRVMDKLFEIHGRQIIRRNNARTTFDAWQGSSNTVFRFYQDMTSPVEERVEYKRDEFFQYYNEYCDWLDIPIEERCKSLSQFDRDLYDSCQVKAYEVKESGKKRRYIYRLYRKYDSSRFNPPDDSDSDNEDMDIPDCGRYPRKR